MTTNRPEKPDMSPEQFRRIEQIFHQAASLAHDQLAAFLDRACADDSELRAQLEALLAQDDPDQSLAELRLRVETALKPVAAPPLQDAMVGQRIGRYRIDSVIGVGGMGAVYAAEQEQPRRAIALKLIKPGHFSDAARRRFEFEAETLGRLQHPAIGQIFEAGTFDVGAGVQPFFAMEFIRGKRLTKFAAEKKLNARQRLELMAKVCEGVHHAHQKGIIHRDLKPGNILVDSHGQPKILDFGVARATDSDVQTSTRNTHTGQLIGTLPYMSPEQTAGDPNDIDARSDVYALGVVAYELLAGRLPYELHGKALPEAVRVIREVDPPPLSSIPRCGSGVSPVDRDVEHMVAKALAKEKERRYQSANEFAADIRRYLNDEPITARPASARYKLRKFTKRHKVLTGVSAATFLGLIAVVIGTSYGLGQAVAAREEESKQRQKAETISGFVTKALVSYDPNQRGNQDFKVVEAMDQAIGALDAGKLKDQPETEAALRLTISQILNGNARSEEALRLAGQALAANERLHPGDHPDVATSLNGVGVCLQSLDRWEEALPKNEAALEMYQRLFEGDHPDAAMSLNNVASCLDSLGRSAEALPKYEAALEMNQRLFEGDHPDVAKCLNGVASCLESLGRSAEALAKYEAALEMHQQHFEGDHPHVAMSLNNLAFCLESLDRSAEALPKYEASLEMIQRIFEGDHPQVATSQNNVAACLEFLGRSAEALPKHEAVLEMRQRIFEGDQTDVAQSLTNVAGCLHSLGRSAEALPKSEAALEMYQRLFEGDHRDVATSLNNVAGCLHSLGRLAEALPKYEASLEMHQRLFEGDHPDVALSLNNVGAGLRSLRRSADALPKLQAALDMRRRLFQGDHPDLANSLHNVAGCLRSLGRWAEALPSSEAALEMYRRFLPPDHPTTLYAQIGLARTLVLLGRFAEALPLLRDVAEQCERSEASRRIHQLSVVAELVVLYDAWYAAEPDQGYDAQAAEWRAKLPPAEHTGSLVKLGKRLLDHGRHADAEAVLRECLEIRQKILAEEHWLIFNTMSVLGESLAGQGAKPSLALRARIEKLRAAEPLLVEGYEGMKDQPEAPDQRKGEALERIVKLYDAWHAAEPLDEGDHGRDAHATKAAEWRAKLAEWQASRQPATQPSSQPDEP